MGCVRYKQVVLQTGRYFGLITRRCRINTWQKPHQNFCPSFSSLQKWVSELVSNFIQARKILTLIFSLMCLQKYFKTMSAYAENTDLIFKALKSASCPKGNFAFHLQNCFSCEKLSDWGGRKILHEAGNHCTVSVYINSCSDRSRSAEDRVKCFFCFLFFHCLAYTFDWVLIRFSFLKNISFFVSSYSASGPFWLWALYENHVSLVD